MKWNAEGVRCGMAQSWNKKTVNQKGSHRGQEAAALSWFRTKPIARHPKWKGRELARWGGEPGCWNNSARNTAVCRSEGFWPRPTTEAVCGPKVPFWISWDCPRGRNRRNWPRHGTTRGRSRPPGPIWPRVSPRCSRIAAYQRYGAEGTLGSQNPTRCRRGIQEETGIGCKLQIMR